MDEDKKVENDVKEFLQEFINILENKISSHK